VSGKEVTEVFYAFGHVNVRATHRSTLEFTKDAHLSKMGDCIIAVAGEKGLMDLSNEFKENLRRPNAKLTITIETDGIKEQIHAHGSPNLLLSHPSDMVVRKSSHVDSRTLGINADKAARDLSRALIEKLREPKQRARITLTARF
jgi:hypothetical protein